MLMTGLEFEKICRLNIRFLLQKFGIVTVLFWRLTKRKSWVHESMEPTVHIKAMATPVILTVTMSACLSGKQMAMYLSEDMAARVRGDILTAMDAKLDMKRQTWLFILILLIADI